MSDKEWRERYGRLHESYERSRREVRRLRAEFAQQVGRADCPSIRAERMEDAIRAYHATLTEGGYVDTVARTEALKKLMEVVE